MPILPRHRASAPRHLEEVSHRVPGRGRELPEFARSVSGATFP
jgi:hypothetical protein